MVLLVAVVVWGLLLTARGALVEGPWSDRALPPDDRARFLLRAMTLDEKLAMLHGPSGECCQCTTSAACAYVGNVAPITRLGIPPITMNDGPQGFRTAGQHQGTSTAWPSGLTMAASWDPDAVREWGAGMGKEFYEKGSNVQLGPGLCLARVPRNGRNFEYIAGEDPHLGYVLAKASVLGIQSQKVVANAKHWALNSQETNREGVSENADERTRFELYYPPFAGAIEAEVGSVMCSYNKLGNAWSCENPETLGRDLKQLLGFRGYVMSDWGATHSASVMQGLDMEMPGDQFMGPVALKAALAAGVVTQNAVNDAVLRVLRPMFAVGVMDEPASTWDWKNLGKNVTTTASLDSARRLSALSTVLLKNEGGLLPLPHGRKLALLGFAGSNAVVHGGGSGEVAPSYVVSPLEGITAAAGAGAEVQFLNGTDLAMAATLAASADYALVFVGTLSHEGGDRPSLSLDDGCDPDQSGQCYGNAHHQNELVMAVAKANPKTIVVASIPGAVLMPWSNDVPAILTNFMPGQQAGNAIADVLFGAVNPSAKLPLTFPNVENETALSPAQWPGLPDAERPLQNYYVEKLLVGYRYYDAYGIKPRFAFGHGLSYTTFRYSGLEVHDMNVSFTVQNSGRVSGAEVAQLYVGFPHDSGEPPLQLKGFRKTKTLAPGASERVEILLASRDLSIWDAAQHAWLFVSGNFKIMVGSSSRDIRLQGQVSNLQQRFV